MATKRHLHFSRVALRLALAAGAAASISGCSDASRFASDPFSDPFGSQTKVASRSGRPIDNVSTGSISGPNTPGPVQSQPLAPPGATASAAPATGGYDHWSAQGGTPVALAEGETPEIVANRYGVPADVLVRINGFSNASDIAPGSRLVIPVYRGRVAEASKPAAAPRQVAEAPKPAPVARPGEGRGRSGEDRRRGACKAADNSSGESCDCASEANDCASQTRDCASEARRRGL